MLTDFAKQLFESGYKVNVAVRIAIFPPWKIQDVQDHSAINFGSLIILGVLYLILRGVTPEGGYGLEVTSVVTLFTFVFLVLCGIVINAIDPTEDAAKLSNRWSTFLIVSFIYSIAILIALYVVPPFLTSGSIHVVDVISSRLGERGALLLLSLFASGVSVGFMYWRTHRWFRDLLQMRPGFFAISLIACIALITLLLFALVFAI